MKPQSIIHLFFEACEHFDKNDAIQVKENGQYVSYSHKFFRQRVSHFARGLMDLGLAEGEHVAILAETRFEWAIADLAIVASGGINVPIYPTLTSEDVAWILDHSDSVGVIVSNSEQAIKVLAEKDNLPKLRFIIMMDEIDSPEGVNNMQEVEQQGAARDNENAFIKRWQARDLADTLSIIYTSGTTGKPKGVVLTHDNMISNVTACEPFMPYTEKDTHLAHLPLSHVFERMAGYYCMLYRGVTIAYAEDIKTVPENIREVRPTILISVPRLYEKIYAKILAGVQSGNFVKRRLFNWAMGIGRKAMPYFNNNEDLPPMLARKWALADKLVFSKVKKGTGGRLTYLFSGGAPLAQEIAEFFIGMKLTLLEGYGLTETSPVLTANLPEKNKPGTVGPPLPGVDIKIADDGEILAKGPNVMKGYYKNPDATHEAIVDGWFHTGDIGYLDQDNYLKITDRKKDILVTSGGKNIAPQPLESALKLSPLIEQAVVIGDKRNFISALIIPPWETVTDWAPENNWPEDPFTLVEHKGFLDTVKREVDKQCADFAHYEQVKKIKVLPQLLTVENGELTPSMKVKRKVVYEKFATVIDDIYT